MGCLALEHAVRGAIRRLLRDERGASFPVVAAVLIPLMGFIGLATDAARGYMIKARLGDALDSAALAGAHEVFSDDFESYIQMYFDTNFPPGYMGADVTLAPPQVDADNEVITLSAEATVGTTFMSLFGHKTLTISSVTEVRRQTVSMDIVLSIDMSGSMGASDGAGSTRIAAARNAAKALVDILFGADETKDHLNIGLVPWNDKVNIARDGESFHWWLTDSQSVPTFTNPLTGSAQNEVYYPNNSPVPLFSAPGSGWPGCVFARYLDDGSDNDADHLFGPVSHGGKDWMAWQPVGTGGSGGGGSDDDDDGGGSCGGSDDDDDGGGSCGGGTTDGGDGGPAPCPDRGITPLTNTKGQIVSAINLLQNPVGATNIAQGLAWGWRVVAPGEPFEQADPFPSGLHERAVILLTDGEQYGRTDDGYKAVFGTGTAAGPAGMDDRLLEIAANVKASGTRIYVIQFYFNSGAQQALMQQVASEPGAPYYFFAPDGDALEEVFEEIATDLSKLRISR